MNKLPELTAGMTIAQACLLEMYHLLVEAGIITEEQAVKRYLKRKKQFSSENSGAAWSLYER